MPIFQASDSDHYITSAATFDADEKTLVEEVAELKAFKEAMLAKQAAGRPSLRVGGRIMLDWAEFDQPRINPDPGGAGDNGLPYGDWQDGVEFRRARMFLEGEAFNVIDYKIAFDFADTDSTDDGDLLQSTAFKDVYVTVNELPLLGHVRVGHFKEPFGLEQLTSTKYGTFIERSVNDDGAIVPGRRIGLMAFDHTDNQRLTWAIGAFRSELDNGGEPPRRFSDNGGTSVTTRCSFLPWYDEATEGRGLFHVGLAFSHRDIDDGTYRFSAHPESHIAPEVVDTADITGTQSVQLYGAEAALVYGPFSMQSEYFHANVIRPGLVAPSFNGCYVYFSYLLSGENRNYDRATGSFRRVKPFENFFRVRTAEGDVAMGKGAWEIGYRYSYLDLNSGGVYGGLVGNHTLGLNWYFNPYTRLMLNYVDNTSTSGDPAVVPVTTQHIFETRVQIDF